MSQLAQENGENGNRNENGTVPSAGTEQAHSPE